MKVTIIIINYNYASYLKDSINSALSQTYANREIIVVDDGSTDNSRQIIESYGDSIEKIYQPNKGMMEASNAGFAKSTGEIVLFLDADDYLYPFALNEIVSIWESDISKVHYRLTKIDKNCKIVGYVPQEAKMLSNGDVWSEIVKNGFYITTPTSGNAFSSKVLAKIFPVKDALISCDSSYFSRIPTDAYLKRRVPFYGRVIAIQKSLGVYRIHGENKGASKSPYLNQEKRQRILYQIKLDSVFIEKHINGNGACSL